MISILLFYFDLELEFHLKKIIKSNNLIRYVISWTLFSDLKNIFIYKSIKNWIYLHEETKQTTCTLEKYWYTRKRRIAWLTIKFSFSTPASLALELHL